MDFCARSFILVCYLDFPFRVKTSIRWMNTTFGTEIYDCVHAQQANERKAKKLYKNEMKLQKKPSSKQFMCGDKRGACITSDGMRSGRFQNWYQCSCEYACYVLFLFFCYCSLLSLSLSTKNQQWHKMSWSILNASCSECGVAMSLLLVFLLLLLPSSFSTLYSGYFVPSFLWFFSLVSLRFVSFRL